MKKIIVFFILAASQNLFSQENNGPVLQPESPSNTFSILKDRLFINCPKEAKSEPRPHNLMSAPPSAEEETRITLDDKDKRLVIFAQEMNALASKTLLADVKKMYSDQERADYLFKEITMKDGMSAVQTIPIKYDSTKEAILINSLLIQTKDSSLVQIGAYISPKAFSDRKRYITLSDSILNTISAGPRQIRFHARKEYLPFPANPGKLLAEVPEHYLVVPNNGADFNEYQIRKIDLFTNQMQGGIIVYVGFYPTLLAPAYQFKTDKVQIKEELFLGKKMKWSSYSDKAKKIYLKELTCYADDAVKGLKIHIAIVASSEKEMDALIKIAAKMALKNQ